VSITKRRNVVRWLNDTAVPVPSDILRGSLPHKDAFLNTSATSHKNILFFILFSLSPAT